MKMLNKKSKKDRNDHGQTSVEYILMFAMVAIMISAVMKEVRKWVLNGKCGKNIVVCKLKESFSSKGFRGFRILK